LYQFYHKRPILPGEYANYSGAGYFTESFGKFNELLVSYYLIENSKDPEQKEFLCSEIYRAAVRVVWKYTGAAIEFNLIQGIITDKIVGPAGLDSSTFATENKYSDFRKSPEQIGLSKLVTARLVNKKIFPQIPLKVEYGP
jgi:oligoendopeptidase F